MKILFCVLIFSVFRYAKLFYKIQTVFSQINISDCLLPYVAKSFNIPTIVLKYSGIAQNFSFRFI